MNYFVVAQDGQKYGPADVATLNGWITDNRLFPQSFLEEEGTGRRFPASSLPGLNFPAAPAPQTAAYPRYGNMPPSAPIPSAFSEQSHGHFLWALGLGGISLLLTFFVGSALIFASGYGVYHAWKSKDDDEHPLWGLAMIICLLAVGLAIFTRINRYR